MESLRRQLDTATVGDRQLINFLHFLAVAVVIGVAVVVGTVCTPSYMVGVGGVTLGTVTSPSAFEDVVDRVKSRATDILDYDYTMDGAVTYVPALTKWESITPVADFETCPLNQIGEVTKSYMPIVNGQFIGTAQDRETLGRVLEQVKTVYVDEDTVPAGFTSRIYITHEYTSSDVNQDPTVMLATLTANTNSQTTYKVQKGDTSVQTTFDNDMSVSELEALSPNVDINRIYVGQLLNMKEETPFLPARTVDNVTYTESIKYPAVEVQDDSIYQGESKVLNVSIPGEQIINTDIVHLNGAEREHTVLSTQVTQEATNKVIAMGTEVHPSQLPNGYFIWPIYERITSYFDYHSVFGSYSYHGDTDVTTPYGINITAVDGGIMIFAGRATDSMWSYGDLATADHGNGKQTYYGRCSSVLASAGDKVHQGQPIVKVGSTGRSTGNHCHFEMRINGTSVSPPPYLS